MPKKITWDWLKERLDAVNVTWLEREANLRNRKIADVIRGKASLSDEELERIRTALDIFR